MYFYSLIQWLLFFYVYCFLGWVWESCYVSVSKRRLINRGFLYGPVLPIYGYGAVAVLFITIPVKNNLFLVFIFGMIGATLLEYITGAVMEKLFRVRYWDYSEKPFNLNGYICILASLGWGTFSVLMIKVLHHPIESIVLSIPAMISNVIALILTVVMIIDTIESFHKAMDLKRVLINLTENNEELMRIEKYFNSIVDILGNDLKIMKEKVQENKKIIEENLQGLGQKRVKALSLLIEKVNYYTEQINGISIQPGRNKTIEIDKIYKELVGFKEKLIKQKENLIMYKNKQYTRALKILRRNPSAVSNKYAEALKQVKDFEQKS